MVLVPLVVFGGLLALAATASAFSGSRTVPALFTVLGLAVPALALYLLARVVGELRRIADALEAREE
jgi:hypothetical protein